MPLLTTGRQIGQTLKNAARLRHIVGVFATHGFQNILERAKLGQFILRKITRNEVLENKSVAERTRLAFEELGPTFVKFGQLLSTRPNLIPPDFVEEFKKFHDQVATVPFSEIKKTIDQEFEGKTETIFSFIDPTPLAAASIAQVHSAQMRTGEAVVIKVQRPHIVERIKEDLGVLYGLAGIIEQYIPESRPYNPHSMVDEFFKTLELETNFIVEANNIRRIAKNFENDSSVKIPHAYIEFSTPKVLVLEKIDGIPFSDQEKLRAAGIDREKIVHVGGKAFFKMVFRDGIFHGDLHAGNLFILPDNRIGVVDFGVVGRVSQKTKDSIANMLLALATEDYEMLTYEYLDLAPYNSKVNQDQLTREIRDLIAPYFGMRFKQVNFGKLLLDSTAIAARYGIVMPSELMLFFKGIVTIEGLGRTIIKDFDVLSFAMEFAEEIVKNRYDVGRMAKDLAVVGRDTSSLLAALPRQLKQLMRKLNSNDFAVDINVSQIEELRKSIQTSGSLQYLGLVIAGLTIASTMALNMGKGPHFYDMPLISLAGYSAAFFFGVIAFYNYMKR
ncbi:MAG: AarF/ABC1/UbiB kinase family protein [Oligoflexia bacterium]|nr:AarF/ABC1/UbiB kinase family protein [Oligoflexia bacterium]